MNGMSGMSGASPLALIEELQNGAELVNYYNKTKVDELLAKKSEYAVEQSIQDVTASRLFDTDYLNDTNIPITLYFNLLSSSGSRAVFIVIDGVEYNLGVSVQNASHADVSVVIPAGSTYRLKNNFLMLISWLELR